MPVVKRTISFSDTTLHKLEKFVPRSQRSRFVDHAVAEALQQEAKLKALEVLENMPKMQNKGSSVVEALREIRQTEVARLHGNP